MCVTKKVLSLLISVLLVLSTAPSQEIFAAGEQVSDSQQNIQDSQPKIDTPLKESDGYRSPPFDTSNLLRKGKQRLHAAFYQQEFPKSFSLFKGNDDSVDEITPKLKNQAGWGDCWAFSALGSAESSLYQNGSDDFDFSERHLAYFTYHGGKNPGLPEDGTAGDSFTTTTPFEGGNFFEAAATLARGTGVEWEDDVPYPAPSDFVNGKVKNDFLTVDKAYHFDSHFQLRECDFLPDEDEAGNWDGSEIKNALQNGTSVSVNYCSQADAYKKVDGLKYPTFYCGQKRDANHSVQIVGWDDSIPASAFSDNGAHPSKPGAWIIKNSWGEQSADHGGAYFYLSYEDKTLIQFCTFTMDPSQDSPRYAHNYQYDGDGETGHFGDESKQGKAANVFTATGDQRLDAVAFYTTDADAQYDIQVYTDIQGDSPESGIKAFSDEQTGSETYPGYHTVDLNEPVSLKSGQKFSVVLSVLNPNHRAGPLALESKQSGYAEAGIQKGQSYYYDGTSWRDMRDLNPAFGNLCLKAFANDIGDEPSVTISLTPTSAQVARGQSQIFHAAVMGVENQNVTWSVSGNTSSGTAIDNTGRLTVAADEKAAKLVVRATSNADRSVYAQTAVTVLSSQSKPGITITPADAKIMKGQSRFFYASVTGMDNPSVMWLLSGNISSGTAIDNTGRLTVAAGEAAETLTVKAVSAADAGVYAMKTVTVLPASPTLKTIDSFDRLDSSIRSQVVEKGLRRSSLKLPNKLEATVDGYLASVKVIDWVSTPTYDSNKIGKYIFQPVIDSDYSLLNTVVPPQITVSITKKSSDVPSHSGGGSSSGGGGGGGGSSWSIPTGGTPAPAPSGITQYTYDVTVDDDPAIVNDAAEIHSTSLVDIAQAINNASPEHHSQVNVILPTAEILNQLNRSGPKSVRLIIKAPSTFVYASSANVDISMNLDSQILQAAKQFQKSVTIQWVDMQTGKVNYSWTFNGTDLASSGNVPGNINLALKVNSINDDAVVSRAIPWTVRGALLTFASNGSLPAPVTIRAFVGNQNLIAGQTLSLYSFNPTLKRLEPAEHPACLVDADGCAVFQITHCSQYVLLPQPAASLASPLLDTGKTLTVRAGKSYVFKATAPKKPSFVSGNNSIFKVAYQGSKGNQYFFKVIAVGKAGKGVGFYVNGEKSPRTIATIVK